MGPWSISAVIVLACVAQVEAPAPLETPGEIEAAIRELGHDEFAVREAAADRLWRTGRKVLPAIEAARKSADSEIAYRSTALWERFRDEIGPDMPPEITALVRDFRTGDATKQKAALDRIQEIDRWDVAVLLLDSDERLEAMLMGRGQAREFATHLVAGAIRAGMASTAHRVLKLAAERELYPGAHRDRVLLAAAEGSLESRIEELAAVAADKRTPQETRELAWALRVVGRFAESKAALPEDEIWPRGDLSIATDDWRDAMRFAYRAKRFENDDPALACVLAWLAGDAKRADEQAALALQGASRKDARAQIVAEAFLAAGRWDDALATMRRRTKPSLGSLDKAVALERFRGRPGEALRLVGATPGQNGVWDDDWLTRPRRFIEGSPSSDRPTFRIQIETILTLHDIGETETADRWLRAVVDEARPAEASIAVAKLLDEGLDRQAVEIAAPRLAQSAFRMGVWNALAESSSSRPGAIGRPGAVVRPAALEGAWAKETANLGDRPRETALAALVARFRLRPESFALDAPPSDDDLAQLSPDVQASILHDACRTALEHGEIDAVWKLLTRTRAIVEGGMLRGNDSLVSEWKRKLKETEGDIALKEGDFDKAAAAYDRASAVDPSRSTPIELAALALDRAGRPKEAAARRLLAAATSLGERDAAAAPWNELQERAAICPAAADAAVRVREFVTRTESWNALETVEACRPLAAVTADVREPEALDRLDPREASRRIRLASFLALPHERSFVGDPIEDALLLGCLRRDSRARIALAEGDAKRALVEWETAIAEGGVDVDWTARVVKRLDDAGHATAADAVFAAAFAKLDGTCQEFPRSARYRARVARLCEACGRRQEAGAKRAEEAARLDPPGESPDR